MAARSTRRRIRAGQDGSRDGLWGELHVGVEVRDGQFDADLRQGEHGVRAQQFQRPARTRTRARDDGCERLVLLDPAIEVPAPGGATSIQRIVGLIGASSRFSKPSLST